MPLKNYSMELRIDPEASQWSVNSVQLVLVPKHENVIEESKEHVLLEYSPKEDFMFLDPYNDCPSLSLSDLNEAVNFLNKNYGEHVESQTIGETIEDCY